MQLEVIHNDGLQVSKLVLETTAEVETAKEACERALRRQLGALAVTSPVRRMTNKVRTAFSPELRSLSAVYRDADTALTSAAAVGRQAALSVWEPKRAGTLTDAILVYDHPAKHGLAFKPLRGSSLPELMTEQIKKATDPPKVAHLHEYRKANTG
ncbi:MAG: hypothetical protein JWO96_395 [Candidatus Saccharibacteria bacterium]|nr:hypothetical protein [Candidatus Saccharibacteria bacterium]